MKNNWTSKAYRTLTSILPVSKNRKGNCADCGECCKLPNVCSFLKIKKGKSQCSVYKFRPLNCRKYPRTKKEQITGGDCSFRFK